MRLATLLVLLPAAGLLASTTQDAARATLELERVIAAPHRTPAYQLRDPYRHPKESLLFFGLRPDAHVAEIWPGGGWYTEILAPYLRENGRYYAAHFYIDETSGQNYRNMKTAFQVKLASDPSLYDRTIVTALRAPDHMVIAPAASLDLVVTFRNVHNWLLEMGHDRAMFNSFFAALKPGGVLGVVEHRARAGTSLEEMKRSGYMTEAYVVSLAEQAGFRLAAKSEINANPKDPTDHAAGVWALPPSYANGAVDREKYALIGESDRMTLKFVKP